MHLTCQQKDLLTAVNTVYRAVASQTTIPILTGILIKAKDSYLYLEATDMELRIKCRIPVDVQKEGKAVLPARYFADLVKRLPDTIIEICAQDNERSILIKYGESSVKLNGFDVDEFPEVDDGKIKVGLSINPSLFSESAKQVSIAASSDESRPVFTGILLSFKEGEPLTMVATDSHRLTMKQVNVKLLEEELLNREAIVPARALNEVGRLLGDAQEDLRIGFSESQVYFECENIFVYSHLIDGQFPNYKDVIPNSYQTVIEIPTIELYSSLNRASLMSIGEYKGKGSIIRIKVCGNNINIYSHSSDIGEVDERLSTEKDGDDLEIAFNVKYLLDVLRVLSSDSVRIEFTGPLSPALVKPAGSKNYLYLVLPVRLQ